MPKLLLLRQKGCAQNMAQSLSDQKLGICLCSLNSSYSEPPRDLWVCLKMKAGSWKQAQTHRPAISQGKAPLLISVSLKATQENSTDTCTPIAQSPNQSTTNFCYPKVRFLTQSHLPRCCLQCFSACPASHDG